MMEHPVDGLSAYIDNEMDAENRQMIEAHLMRCESCAATLNEMVEIKSQVAGFYMTVEPPLHLEQKVMQAIELKSPVQLRVRSWLAISLAGVLCLAALWFALGPIVLKLVPVLYKVVLAAVYLLSNCITSIPSVYGTVLMVTLLLIIISGISLRRLLRSTTQ